MNHHLSKLRPFLIGIAGGSASGKHILGNSIKQSFQSFNVTIISLNNYYKSLSTHQMHNPSEYNFDCPEAFDFDLLYSHIISLRNGQSVDLPVYDYSLYKRLHKTHRVDSCSVIVFEGILAFYDMRIRNLMDLKIFIETDSDVRLARRIYRDVEENKYSLNEIIKRYHTHVKPSYEMFIGPTKMYADIIIPGGIENKHAINLVSEYMKKQVNKLMKCDRNSLFTSMNEIVDPKFQFFDNKILVTYKEGDVEFLKEVFHCVIGKEVSENNVHDIRKKLIEMLHEIFMNYLKRKPYFNEHLPQIDLIITENDDVNKIDIAKYKNILLFKTAILNEDDMNIPEKILTLNPNCNLIINSIFLAPKFAELILGVRLNCVMINTLYFSDFFIKFEQFIIDDTSAYNSSKLSHLFTNHFHELFNSTNPKDI